MSVSPDNEIFFASDESRINMFHIEKSQSQIYNLIDYERKSTTVEDEMITNLTVNPFNSSMLLFTTSTGKINMCDLRERSEFSKRPSLVLENTHKNSKLSSNVFSKWINSVSEAKFVSNPYQIFSRDYLSVKLWDIRGAQSDFESYSSNNITKPIYSAQVTDYMERNLGTLLENDSLDDQFFIDLSPDGKHIATGGYNRSGHVLDINTTTNTVIKTVFGADRDSKAGKLRVYGKAKRLVHVSNHNSGSVSRLDLKKRVGLGSWAPQKDP